MRETGRHALRIGAFSASAESNFRSTERVFALPRAIRLLQPHVWFSLTLPAQPRNDAGDISAADNEAA
jgi:hypothetical protein